MKDGRMKVGLTKVGRGEHAAASLLAWTGAAVQVCYSSNSTSVNLISLSLRLKTLCSTPFCLA